MAGPGPSTTQSEFEYDESEMDGTETPAPAEEKHKVESFPPYPPYTTQYPPPTVADTVVAGREIRVQHKSKPPVPVRPLPKPAKPLGPRPTDRKPKRTNVKSHKGGRNERVDYIAKPRRRNVIQMWREYAHVLRPETVQRCRTMLDADEPLKPDQAYEYFVNMKKAKKKADKAQRLADRNKDVITLCGDKRFLWARNATVQFARGIQQRLTPPTSFVLEDRMQRLSDIIKEELCHMMQMPTVPCRRNTHPKSKFITEMSDKVAVWTDQVLEESDERMLMMDFDEDEEVEAVLEEEARLKEEEEAQKEEEERAKKEEEGRKKAEEDEKKKNAKDKSVDKKDKEKESPPKDKATKDDKNSPPEEHPAGKPATLPAPAHDAAGQPASKPANEPPPAAPPTSAAPSTAVPSTATSGRASATGSSANINKPNK